MSAASGDTVNIVMDGIGEEGGATGGPRWASPTHTPANKTTTPDEEAMRLQQAIEEGDVQLAMQWSSQLAQRKLKLNVSVDPDQDVSDEEDIQVKIYIEDKDQSVGCLTKDVKPSVTITTLKLMMLECHGFPPEIQTWIIGERLVRDDETLTKCGVKSSGACLYLYLVSAQSVGLSQEEFSRKYGHLVKPATPGLPRSLSQTSSFGTKSIPNTPGSTAVPWDQESQYMSMRNLLGEDFKQGTPPPKALTLPRSKHDVKPSTPPKPPPRLPSKPPPPVTEDENKEKYGWSCPACTYVNWPTWPGCEVCDSSVPQDYKAPDNYTLSKREQERMDREKVEEATAREGGSLSQATGRGDAPQTAQGVIRLDEELAQQLHQRYLRQQNRTGTGGVRTSATEEACYRALIENKTQPVTSDENNATPEVSESNETNKSTKRLSLPGDLSSSIITEGPLFWGSESDSDSDIGNHFV